MAGPLDYAAWISEYEACALLDVIVIGAEALSPAERLPFCLRGRCAGATLDMVDAFPELTRVRGHYGHVPHWWCVAPDGTIYDPTVGQFRDRGLAYVPYDGPDPIGKCMNCGEYIWTTEFGTSACSKDCSDALHQYYSTLRVSGACSEGLI